VKTPRTLPCAAFLASISFVAAVLAGCSSAPRPGEPLRPAELRELAAAVGDANGDARSVRSTGDCEITVSGRTLRVAFAALYERPGWLRADLRPELGVLGADLAAMGTLENGCARMFFPARLVVVTGCVSDIAGDAAGLDLAALVLGIPDASIITGLEGVSASRVKDHVRVTGRLGSTAVALEIDETLPAITSIELLTEGSEDGVLVEYGGHGWKSRSGVPRTVELTAREGTSYEMSMNLRYETFRQGEGFDREEHELVVPDGVLEIDWRQLNIWR
jgi:hypothetical protein